MTSRKEVIDCENCNITCYFDHSHSRWMSDKGPMFTGKHCSLSCYQSVIRILELEFTLNSENRTNIVRRLNIYKEMDKYRCKICGSVMRQCWCE
jgi:hypothetical protein